MTHDRLPTELFLTREGWAPASQSRRRRLWTPLPIGLGLRLFPGLFAVAYLSATVLLFAYGPWPWPIKDPTTLYGFLVMVHASLFLGYLLGLADEPRGYSFPLLPKRLYVTSLMVTLALLFPTVAARTGSFIPNVLGGLSNPGAAYNLSLEVREGGGALVIVEYLRILLAPLLAPAVPLTIYYWRSLHRWARSLGALTIAGVLATYVASGTNKAIADTILLAPWLIFASHVAGFRRLRLRHFAASLITVLLAFVLFFLFFTAGQLTRRGSGASAGYFSATNMFANQDHVLVRWLPPAERAGALALIMYVTHGYYGLNLSMQEPFVPMFGAGNSLFLQRTVARVLDAPSFTAQAYPMRTEHRGWSALGLWSTAYVWFASDVSFPGVLFVVFIVGRLYAQTWLDALDGGNPLAIVAFSMLTLMLLYLPANNQLLQDGEPFVAFAVTVFLWRLTRGQRLQPQS